MPFEKKKNPVKQKASRAGHLARWSPPSDVVEPLGGADEPMPDATGGVMHVESEVGTGDNAAAIRGELASVEFELDGRRMQNAVAAEACQLIRDRCTSAGADAAPRTAELSHGPSAVEATATSTTDAAVGDSGNDRHREDGQVSCEPCGMPMATESNATVGTGVSTAATRGALACIEPRPCAAGAACRGCSAAVLLQGLVRCMR